MYRLSSLIVKGSNARINPGNIYNAAGQFGGSSIVVRSYSAEKRPSFFANVKKFLMEDDKMQKDIDKFRAETSAKYDDSQVLKEVRRKFENIESETSKNSGVIKEKLSEITDKVKQAEGAKKVVENVAKTAEDTAKLVGGAAESLGKTDAFKAATTTASAIKEEIDGQRLGGKVYVKSNQLRLRKNPDAVKSAEEVEVDENATEMELHKDSKFYQAFQNFKESPVFNKFTEARLKYDESDHVVARGARLVTDKMSDLIGGMFSKTELSETLTEICKIDPNFCREQFLKDCERDIIPNILEAINVGDLEILEDWCFEAPFNILATPIKQARQLGYILDSRLLDIDDVDLALGKMMEQGPIMGVTFNAQQIMCVRDSTGKVVEGDPEKVMRIGYVFLLCRDQTEFDPKAAWRLLEVQAYNSQEQYL